MLSSKFACYSKAGIRTRRYLMPFWHEKAFFSDMVSCGYVAPSQRCINAYESFPLAAEDDGTFCQATEHDTLDIWLES